MRRASDKFVIIHEDYLLITDEDAACALILKIIESFSYSRTGRYDSWVSVNARAIEKLTLGMVAQRTVSKKIKELKQRDLIEVRLGQDNWPSYKLNIKAIEAAAYIEVKRRREQEEGAKDRWLGCLNTEESGKDLYAGSVYPMYCDDVPSTPADQTLPPGSVDINSIENSIKKKERTSHLTDIVGSTVDVDLTCLPNRKEHLTRTETLSKEENSGRTEQEQKTSREEENLGITVLIEKEHQHEEQCQSEEKTVHEGEEEKNMNEEVRALLKSYDKIPRNKRTDICKKSITALYQKHGDDLEKNISLYGFDECMKALENYKADEFWESKGFPISGYIKQIERFLENTSGNPGPYRGVGKKEKIAPRAESAQIPAIPAAKIDDDPNAEYRKMVRAIRMRVGEVTTMVKITTPEKLAEFEKLTQDLATVNPVVIEEWFSRYSELWKQKHGGFAYKGLSKPLC